jgi:superfamily II DNA helicase RecQ
MFFGPADLVTQRRLQSDVDPRRVARDLDDLERYATAAVCRQRMLCAYFTGRDEQSACGLCDVCSGERIAAPPPRRARQSQLMAELEGYRIKMARALRWKAYMVFQDRVIAAIEEERPRSLAALERVPGLGPAKIARFGRDILDMVRRHD